jgi:hypothetical protein
MKITTRPGALDEHLRVLCNRVAADVSDSWRMAETMVAQSGDPPWLRKLLEMQKRGLLPQATAPDVARGRDDWDESDHQLVRTIFGRVPSVLRAVSLPEAHPWFIVTRGRPHRLQRMVELDRMATEVSRVATQLLPPWLILKDGSRARVSV